MPAREAFAPAANRGFVVPAVDDPIIGCAANRTEHGSVEERGGAGAARPAPLGWMDYEDAPILNSFVEQSGHSPWTAGRPFFMVTCVGFFISFFALHFTQYASGIESLL